MVTWFGVGLDRGVTPRSKQGHLKVTGRSNQIQIGENSLFLLVLLHFNSLEMPMVVKTHIDHSMEIYQNIPWGYRDNIRAGGVIPHQITLMSPLLHMAENQIIQRLSCLDQWPVLQIHYEESQPKYTWWHGLGLGLTGVLLKGHKKVIARSQKGQISLE